MRIFRIATACLIFALGTATLLVGLLYALGPNLVAQTVEHNKQLEGAFRLAVRYVASFKEENGQLPTSKEFEAWAGRHASAPYSSPNGMTLQLAPFPEDAVMQFGSQTEAGYLLVYWRGEWFEYYASWVDRTSLEFEESNYYALGSKYADGSALIAMAALVLLLGKRLWPNPSFQRTAFGGR